MATTENEYYLNASLLLAEGGSYISKKVLYREHSGDLNELLQRFKHQLRPKLNEKQIRELFPGTGNTIVDTWGLQLLITVLLTLFHTSLTQEDKLSLRKIKGVRSKLHDHSLSLDAGQYVDIIEELTDAMTTLASSFEDNVQQECRSFIIKYKSDPLGKMSARECLKQLENIDVLDQQVLEKVEISKNDTCTHLDATKKNMSDVKKVSQQITETVKYYDSEESSVGYAPVDETSALDISSRSDDVTKDYGQVSGQRYGDALESRLQNLFKKEQIMKGRQRELDKTNINDIMHCCQYEKAGSGGFGDIYISKEKIPGLDMRVVLKKIQCTDEHNIHKMRSITNEKLASRTMHYGIVPLLAMGCIWDERTYYFLTPYMENDDLYTAIEKDNVKLKEKGTITLDVDTRIRILYQIASAVDFLHTPVKNFRGAVLHMDIKAQNIVLDMYYNARLIDFGLAREMREGTQAVETTMTHLPHTPGHYRTIKHSELTMHADYYNFGVVIRQLLTGKKPYDDAKQTQLRKFLEKTVMGLLLNIWMTDKKVPFEIAGNLVKLSTKCLTEEDMTSTYIVKEIEKCIRDRGVKRQQYWGRSYEHETATDHVEKCEICMERKAVTDKVIQHAANCRNNINVCVPCMMHSYCNPIRCHSCDENLIPTIGHGWGALLIAGNDTNEGTAHGFAKDIMDVHEVITSKFPLVMGIRKDDVALVRPNSPGSPEMFKEKNGQLDQAFETLNKINNIHTLLIYFSGHHYDGKGFQLGSAEEFLSLEELQTKISSCLFDREEDSTTSPSQNKRLVVFLDCCSAPCIKLPENISIVQLNACRPTQTTDGDPFGSKFTIFFKQGLTGRALSSKCYNTEQGKTECCNHCVLPGEFVTLQNLCGYITNHLEPYKNHYQPVTFNSNTSDNDIKVGYATPYSVSLCFTFKLDKEEKRKNYIPPRMFTDMITLQRVLSERFIEVMKPGENNRQEPLLGTDIVRDILCIKVENGPKRMDELDSLERVMTAWYAKRDLIVSLRGIGDIRQGTVGIFLEEDCSVEPIKRILDKHEYVKEQNWKETSMYSITLDNLHKISVSEDNRSLETFKNILSKLLEEGLLEEDEFKELHIKFPCTHEGKQRDDFICFQVAK